MLLLFISTQAAPATAGFINMNLVVGDLWPPLNATGPSDAIFWTEAELYTWIDQAAKRLARKTGGFVVYDTSLATVLNTADYTLPTRHIATIQADVAGRLLRPRNVQEMEALDADWVGASSAAPKAFLEDTQGLGRLTLAPPPSTASQAIGLLMIETPADISKTSAILSAPDCIQDYFAFSALAEARTKETNASMDETAQWFGSIAATMEKAIAELWQ